jgi:beta-lactamase regulating signal transducer with metallopeptidase domain/regulation of enolase protein 1 (concanavalin A-like superfamily)
MTTILALLLVERLGWVLMHSLWQFMAIALVVRLFERTFAGRRSASLRYAAGMCGLAAITAVPVATWFLIPEAPAPMAGAVSAVPVDDNRKHLQVAPQRPPAAVRPGPVPTSADAVDQPRAQYSLADARATLALRLRPWLPILVVGWLVGMSLCSLRPLVGWLTLRRLRTVGISAVSEVLAESAQRIAARLGVTQALSIWQSTATKTPLVVGYLRPILLIPVAMLAELPLAEAEAILAHELAHVRRYDFLVNLWQTLLETLFYYHPAVWSVSRRLRAEREHCCDDVALSIVGDPVCYGRALLHVEELRGAESLLAFGAGGGSLRGRILRLFDQSSQPVSVAGLFADALLPSMAIAGLLAAMAWGAPAVATDESQTSAGDKSAAVENRKRPAKPEPGTAVQAAAARSLDIVITKHVILWDGRIRSWDEVITELREIRKAKGEPIHPHFHFTNGAHSAGHFKTYQAKVMDVYPELFEPAGVSIGFMSPRAGARYDAIRKADDLIPNQDTLRSGIVVENGEPKAGVLVVLVPQEGAMPVMLKPDLTLRDPHDEVWTVTGPDGRFTLPVQPALAVDDVAVEKTPEPTYSLAAISPTAYGLASIPPEAEEARIELLPPAYVQLTPVEGKEQRIDLSLGGGLSDTSPGFSIYEIELRDEARLLRLPAGKITVLRSFLHQDGGSRGYPTETMQLRPGASRKITLPNITEEEAERKWREDSLRPKPDPDDVLDVSRVRAAAPRAAFAAAAADDQPASAKRPDNIDTIEGSWTVTDPDKDCEVRLTGEKLSITVPATNHDLNAVRGLNAPRVLKKFKGDFVVQVKVTADFKPGATSTGSGRPFNGAGILLWQNEENFLRVERNAYWIGGALYCYPPIMEYWHDRQYKGANNDPIGADYFKGRSTWLRVNRQGQNIAVSISHDGKQWSEVKTFSVELADELFVGVAALNTSDTPFTVDFEELTIESK